MRGKLGILLTATLFLLSCSNGEKVSKAEKVKKEKGLQSRVCSDDTVLAEGKDIKVTLADYRSTWKLLNPKAKEFFKNHPEELLRRMVNRRLVLAYVKDSGLAKEYGLDREMEEFKKEYLSRKFVSDLARKRVKPISEEEIEKRFRELFPNKDPKEISQGDREFIKNELQVKAYDRAVSSVYSEIEKKLKVVKKDGKLTIECCGIKVSEELGKDPKKQKEKLKERFLTEYFYNQALKAGYDKDPEFKRMFTEYFAGKAIEVFKRELSKKIEVKPEEVEDYYQRNKEKFKMPERVKAVVFYFSDEKRAKEAKELLDKGKSWQEVAKRFGQFNARERVYYKDAKDPIGVAIFSIGNPKGKEAIIISLSEKRYALVYPVQYIPGGPIPFDKAKKFIELKLKERKLREAEEKELSKLWKEYKVKLENLSCLR